MKYSLLTILLILCFSCGLEQAYIPVNFMQGKYLIPKDTDSQIIETIYTAISTYEENYGACPITVRFNFREYPFNLDGQLAGGASYGGLVEIGIHHTSSCDTCYVIFHELTHSCRGIHNEEDYWQKPLWELTYQLANKGMCKNGTKELYNPYLWN